MKGINLSEYSEADLQAMIQFSLTKIYECEVNSNGKLKDYWSSVNYKLRNALEKRILNIFVSEVNGKTGL